MRWGGRALPAASASHNEPLGRWREDLIVLPQHHGDHVRVERLPGALLRGSRGLGVCRAASLEHRVASHLNDPSAPMASLRPRDRPSGPSPSHRSVRSPNISLTSVGSPSPAASSSVTSHSAATCCRTRNRPRQPPAPAGPASARPPHQQQARPERRPSPPASSRTSPASSARASAPSGNRRAWTSASAVHPA